MSFGTIPLSPDDKPDGFVLSSMYEKLESENEKLRNKISESWLFSSKLLLAIVMSRSYDELFEAAQGMFRDGSLDGEKGLDELIRKLVDELEVEVN